MNLFRSEEHVSRWKRDLEARREVPEPEWRPVYGARHKAPYAGEIIPVGQLAALAQAWWHDRLDPAWRPHTREQNQATLDSLGLTGEFWQLP